MLSLFLLIDSKVSSQGIKEWPLKDKDMINAVNFHFLDSMAPKGSDSSLSVLTATGV